MGETLFLQAVTTARRDMAGAARTAVANRK